jgi:protein phosphatase
MYKQIPPEIVQEVGYCTDIGQERKLNEDFIAVEQISSPTLSGHQPIGIYVLADGMGGHQKGEVASHMAVNSVVRKLKNECTQAIDELPGGCMESLKQAFRLANATMRNSNEQRGSNMGTTLVTAVIPGHDAYVANVGDSRAYTISPTGIQQITEDHTMAQKMLAGGVFTAQQAEKHPFTNVLTRAIGLEDELEVDLFKVGLSPGDYLLLCSDGLTKELDDRTLAHLIRTSASPQQACATLVAAANDAGGHDNISMIVVRLMAEETATQREDLPTWSAFRRHLPQIRFHG